MAKRMIIMLVLMAALVGGLGFLKYRQVESAIAAGASFQIPPDVCDHRSRKARDLAFDLVCNRDGRRNPRRYGERGPARDRR